MRNLQHAKDLENEHIAQLRTRCCKKRTYGAMLYHDMRRYEAT
jgi:hypothetical protein